MKASFTIEVIIENNNVQTLFNSEKNEDLNIELLGEVLKSFSKTQNDIKARVAKFYNAQGVQESADHEQESQSETVNPNDDNTSTE